jgi:hypothetical protein
MRRRAIWKSGKIIVIKIAAIIAKVNRIGAGSV